MLGTQVAHYTIVEKLGEGGMGTVYKARDQHLDRFVAIKFLRADKLRDTERKRRFILEAKAASALNHPNIITIYDVSTSGDLDYIAMECVQGHTLAELIRKRPLSVQDTLKYGVQAADALAAAHGAGILHRDLKPGNVMVTETGLVKVLDFGLAKLIEPQAPDPSQPTQTLRADPATEEGQILGTAAYMAPEQVEGKKVDARTDVFAFGILLYEMLTGKRVFERPSRISTLSAVLQEQPPAITDPAIPAELLRVVTRCLRKEPDRRYQTMRDVRNALDEIREDSESGRLTAPVALPAKPGSQRSLVLVGTAVAAGLAALAGFAIWNRTHKEPASTQLQLRAITSDSGSNIWPTISRDGKLVAYASNRGGQNNLDIWLQPLTEGAQAIRLTRDDADDTEPDFSPDGGLIVFRSARNGGGLYVTPTYGGEARLLVRGGYYPRFSPDGKTVVYSSGFHSLFDSALYSIPITGGQPTRFAADVPWAVKPGFSPDGARVFFLGAPRVNAPVQQDYDLWTVPVRGGPSLKTGISQAIPQARNYWSADWAGDRMYLVRQRRIWAIPVGSDGRAAGPPNQLSTGAGENGMPRLAGLGGALRMVFANGTRASHMWRQKIDWNQARLSGELEALTHSGGSQDQLGGVSLQPRLVYTQFEPQGVSIRLRDLAAGTETTLASVTARARISPDGSHVAYSTFVEGDRGLYLMPSGGGDAAELISPKEGSQALLYGWLPDNKKITYSTGSPVRFMAYDVARRKTDVLISHPTLSIHNAEVSLDQQWISFVTPIGNESPLYIAPMRDGQAVPEPDWIRIADKGNNRRPWWSPNGRVLYFTSERDGFRCFRAQRLDPVSKRPVGEPIDVKHFHEKR
ncbi:MAG: serine/threonine-protein kinase, partial [Bryobacterales bacterium]|nr:serine/threonine-protein kinase [Bryobacterales bacterium]